MTSRQTWPILRVGQTMLTRLAIGHHEPTLPPPIFGPRQMLPPSPTHYQPRYTQAPSTAPSPSVVHPQEPRHRPGSSMSISSMLGSDADRPVREPPRNYGQYNSAGSNPGPGVGAMSPPQHTPRPAIGEYSYKPRSQTPEQFGFPNPAGARTQRSSSGTMMQRPGPFSEPLRPPTESPYSRFGEPAYSPQIQNGNGRYEELEQARRTSITGLMQRPNSQPQPQPGNAFESARPSPFGTPSSRPAWLDHNSANSTDNGGLPTPRSDEQGRRQSLGEGSRSDTQYQPRQSPVNGYDTRPPLFGNPSLRPVFGPPEREPLPPTHAAPPPQTSPEGPRQVSDPSPNRGLSRLLNEQPRNPVYGPETQSASQPMTQQDSAQSHSERSIFGERLDRRSRLFSPFGSSITSQPMSGISASADEHTRKGSDESSQHRALLGIAAEAKRGRYSPLPQAVQGAQAQSVGPETGIKTESGRVFSGIGSGIINANVSSTTGPPGLSASPFKRDDGAARLSEENLMKVSRSTPGVNMGKRARRLKDEEGFANSDAGDGRNTSIMIRGKKPRQSYQNKLDNDDIFLQRRTTPMNSFASIRRIGTPLGSAHDRSHVNVLPPPPNLKPNTTIKISPVLNQALRKPRRHLGSFVYSPIITVPDTNGPARGRLNVSIRPNLLPSFRDPDQVNCTYTVRVSRTWLRQDEREAICAEHFLWGSGIFTDDSDPISAAVHSGFVKGAWPEWIDVDFLAQIIKEQNPKVDAGQENVPAEPLDPLPNMDLHITMLVLPQLEHYEQSVRYGVKSRTWPEDNNDAPHDGVSFLVLKCELVDEGSGRGKDRTGVARRNRLDDDFRRTIMKSGDRKKANMPAVATTTLARTAAVA